MPLTLLHSLLGAAKLPPANMNTIHSLEPVQGKLFSLMAPVYSTDQGTSILVSVLPSVFLLHQRLVKAGALLPTHCIAFLMVVLTVM